MITREIPIYKPLSLHFFLFVGDAIPMHTNKILVKFLFEENITSFSFIELLAIVNFRIQEVLVVLDILLFRSIYWTSPYF